MVSVIKNYFISFEDHLIFNYAKLFIIKSYGYLKILVFKYLEILDYLRILSIIVIFNC